MEHELSDSPNNTSSTRWDAARSVLNEYRGLAKLWSSPLDLYQELKRLVVERPMVGIGAAVALGFILHGRLFRRSLI
jgi:hypothetical protein